MQVVELKPRGLISETDKQHIVNALLEVVKEVQDGHIESFFGAWSYGPRGTGGFRAGSQDLSIVGRIEWLKQRMIAGIE